MNFRLRNVNTKQEQEHIEAEIRVQSLEAKVAELKRIKAHLSLQIPTTDRSDEKKMARSSLDDCTLLAPTWRGHEAAILDGFMNLSESRGRSRERSSKLQMHSRSDSSSSYRGPSKWLLKRYMVHGTQTHSSLLFMVPRHSGIDMGRL